MKPHKHAEIIKASLHKFWYFEGNLYWSENFGSRAKKGSLVGSIDGSGYLQVKLNGKPVLVHRIIWIMHNDSYPDQIDHIDRNRKNNRIENLRAANNTLNQHNTSMRKDNSTGVTGVHYKNERYQARIQSNGVRIQLGTFDTLDEAANAYRIGKEKYHVKAA
jgi:hypothetical protein